MPKGGLSSAREAVGGDRLASLADRKADHDSVSDSKAKPFLRAIGRHSAAKSGGPRVRSQDK